MILEDNEIGMVELLLVFNFTRADIKNHHKEICEQLVYEIDYNGLEWEVVDCREEYK
jgi:hypothetical protein